MNKINNYVFYCETEAKEVCLWAESISTPLLCPNDTAHVVNQESLSISGSIEPNETILRDGTQGYYQSTTIPILIPAGTPGYTYIFDYSFPYDIAIWTSNFTSSAELVGDSFDIIIGPNSTIGYLTQQANIGDTVLHCSDTVFSTGYMANGIHVTIKNGATEQNVEHVSEVNPTGKTIRVFKELESTYNIGSLVQINTYIVKNQVIGNVGKTYHYGSKGIATRKVPKGVNTRFLYKNNNGLEKNLYFDMEYNYM
jgi:hypothetical protein